MTAARLAGRVAGVPRPLGFLPCSAGRVLAGQVGCGMAWMRCQAVTTGSAQGQVPAIFRNLRRPPRTRRAAACRAGGVQDAVAQRLRLRPGRVAVQGDELQPGQQDAGDHGRVEPRLVDLVVVRGEVAEPGVLAGADAVLVVGGGGEWPGPVSLPVRMTSSTRAWTRCAASM